MRICSCLTAAGLGLGLSAAALATPPTFLASSGNDLFRVNADGSSVEHFEVSDSLISMNLQSDGRVLGYSNTRNANDEFEVYEVLNPFAGVPSLSLVGTRTQSLATQTQIGGVLYGIQLGNLYTVDQTTFAPTLVGALSGLNTAEALQTGSSAYDGSTFFLSCRDANLYTVDVGGLSATLVGGLGIPSVNQGMECANGRLFGAFGDDATDLLEIGELNKLNGSYSGIATIDVSGFGGLGATGFVAIPAPGAAALLGLGALVAGRRRR